MTLEEFYKKQIQHKRELISILESEISVHEIALGALKKLHLENQDVEGQEVRDARRVYAAALADRLAELLTEEHTIIQTLRLIEL
jgi:hypothetical protein